MSHRDATQPARAAPRARSGRSAAALTPRERQVIAAVLDGCSNKGIARRLRIKEQTAKNALSVIYEKVGVKTRLALALYAVKHHLTRDL